MTEKEYNKAYYQTNKDKIKARSKLRRELKKEEIKIKDKERRLNNKEKIKEYNKIYTAANKDKILQQKKTYAAANKDRISQYKKAYRETHKNKINEWFRTYRKNRCETDPLFKLKRNIQTAIYNSMIRKDFTKTSKTVHMLGCSFLEFKQHLESKFQPWMNWNNYGKYNGELNYGWDIDHIVPLDTAITAEDVIRLNHYTNLQPLCSYINRCVKVNSV